MDIFEKIMPGEYALHDKLEKHAAYSSMLVLGGFAGAIIMFIVLTVLSFVLNLF
jgi:hypothetical protein